MHIWPFQAVYPNKSFLASPDAFLNEVKEHYTEYRTSGFFKKSAQESIYIYQILTPERSFTGIICCVEIEDFINGMILKHEQTLAAKEQQHIYLLLNKSAMVKPVLLTYPEVDGIEAFIKEEIKNQPAFLCLRTDDDSIEHKLWDVNEGDSLETIRQLFLSDVPLTYIADGHHRISAMTLLHQRRTKEDDLKYSQLFCALFPMSELAIKDYNRVIKNVQMKPSRLMAHLSRIVNIELQEEAVKPNEKHRIGMWLDEDWYELKWKEEILALYQDEEVVLDADLLNKHVLMDIFGIQDVRADDSIIYIAGPLGLNGIIEKCRKESTRVGFCLHPVEVQELVTLAEAGKTLPPKSTWFEPRIKNGLLVKELH